MMKNNILSWFLVIAVYIILGLAIIVESKWVYVLIFLTAIVILCLLWKERFNTLKLWAIIMLIYAALVLIGWNGDILVEKTKGNPLVTMFVLLTGVFALHSIKIMMIILGVGIIFVKPIVKCFRIAIGNVIYGPLPEVRKIAKGNRKGYLYHDYHTKQIQIIFRTGSKKKILDAYESKGVLNPEEHYSLEWKDDNELIVRKYNVYNHEIIMERNYKVPRY